MEITKKDILTPLEVFEKSRNISETRNDLSERYLGRPSARYYKEVDFSETLPKVLKKAGKLMASFEKKYSR